METILFALVFLFTLSLIGFNFLLNSAMSCENTLPKAKKLLLNGVILVHMGILIAALGLISMEFMNYFEGKFFC
jgi:putative effector of murein hydrolase